MAKEAQPLVVVDEEHFTDKRFVTDPKWFEEEIVLNENGEPKKILPNPVYTVQEAAKFFFGKSPDWLRWRSKKTEDNPLGFFLLDGEPLPDHRTDVGFRYYTLADIERMGHALAQNGGIDGATMNNITSLVKASCRLYGYI